MRINTTQHNNTYIKPTDCFNFNNLPVVVVDDALLGRCVMGLKHDARIDAAAQKKQTSIIIEVMRHK